MEPTQEEKQKFLEACGASVSGGIFTFNDGQGGFSVAFWEPTLDFLFKHAVPKVCKGDLHLEVYTTLEDTAVTIKRATNTVSFRCLEDPAQALFWALSSALDKTP